MKNATDITIILDRSGSMESIKNDTIGGINTFIVDQQKADGECRLTLVQFDTQAPQEVVLDAVPIRDAKPLTEATFIPRGGTPLYDAVGLAIVRTGERLTAMPETDRPGKVIVVIVTDGEENSSREYNQKRVFEMVKTQTETYQWSFVYLGANQDAMKAAHAINIPSANAMSYTAQPNQVRHVYASMSANVKNARAAGPGAPMSASLGWSDDQRKKAIRPTGPKR